MNRKNRDYVLQYFLVIIACVIVGFISRYFYRKESNDDFGGTIIFLGAAGFAFVIYLLIIVLLDEFLEKTNFVEWVRKKVVKENVFDSEELIDCNNQSKNEITEISNAESQTKEKGIVEFLPSKETGTLSESEIGNDSVKDFNKIRTQQQVLLDKKKQDKLDVALDYTRKKFALYTNDEDLSILCDAIKNYSDQKYISEDVSITTTELSNLDLYHFGWNIWNYFKVTNQDSIAKFLKSVFASLKDVEQGSIKSHLRDDEKKGIIKIEEIAYLVD